MTLLTRKTNDLVFCWLKSDNSYAKHLNLLLKDKSHKRMIEILAYAASDAFVVKKSFYDKHSSTIEKAQNLRSY